MTTRKTVAVKISKLGVDVKTAPDSQLLFNSEWPLLKIAKRGKFTIPGHAGGTIGVKGTIYEHNLGFIPAFRAYYPTGAQLATPATVGQVNDCELRIDERRLYYYTYGFETVSDMDIYYYIFYHDLEAEPFLGEILNRDTSYTRKNNRNYVFKVSLPGKDISSRDLRDFAINSNANNLPIHAFGMADMNAGGNYQATIKHRLGYRPIYDAYYRADGTDYFVVAPTRTIADGTDITWRGVQSVLLGDLSYIIYKDPILNA